MERNYIALAIPFFFIAIGVELLVAWRRRRSVYRFQDAIGDLGCGVSQQLTLVFINAGLLAGYDHLYRNHSLIHFDKGSVLPWVIAFFGVDFIYYWWHRLSHEVNFLWAAHIVHHQSEDFNLAVALRQAVTTPLTAWPFYASLAFLGVPVFVYATIHSFSLLYQFWIHTELIRRMGWFEWPFNTPSHHRVHHGINPEYLDRNYGGTLILWDRLFGSFEPEGAPVVYGITKPLRSFNPLWAQVHYWIELVQESRLARAGEKLKVWWKGPAWHPEGVLVEHVSGTVSPETFAKYDPPLAAGLAPYMAIHFALAVAAVTMLLLLGGSLPWRVVLGVGLLGFLTLGTLSGLGENRRWARPAEVLRLVLVGAAVVFWSGGEHLLWTAPVVLGAVGVMAFWVVRRRLPAVAATALVCGLTLFSCAGPKPAVRVASPEEAYVAAVRDAAVAEAPEVSKQLIAVVEGNPRLVWSEPTAERRVLVSTWTSWNGYDDRVGKALATTRETWVTAAPEVQRFCRGLHLDGEALLLRLEQLLGLPPHNGKTKFVELWVRPADLFRPCPDPEINDQECTLDFPPGTSEAHRRWIEELKAKSYGEKGYPWTQLGYTYDWGNGATKIGASEFVIRSGAEVEVRAVAATGEYCTAQ